ncbi:MAG: beta-hydroxyacyl-ACP dehydratase [Planctomycetota bacterium]
MHFSMVDRVLEQSEDRIVTVKLVSNAEEYLRDHFPGFPVLPGVMMLESMVQAGRLLADPDDDRELPLVLGGVRALKYGSFVRPGSTIRVTVTRNKPTDDDTFDLKGDVRLIEPGDDGTDESPVACSGRFVLRPARVPAGG